jgi:hypothetical protein
MSKYLFSVLLFLSLLLGACGSETTSDPNQKPGGDSVSIKDSLSSDSTKTDVADSTSIAPGESVDADQKSVAKGTFTGQITVVRPYCGGAAPSKEILERAKIPVPFAGQKFFLKKGNTNRTPLVAANFTTDNNGNFYVLLPPGKYCLCAKEQTLDNQFHPELYDFTASMTDLTGYQKWWSDCRFTFEIKPGAEMHKNLNFNINCMTESICPFVFNSMANRLP